MAGYQPPGVSVSIQSEGVNPRLISGDEVLCIMGESNTFPANFTDSFSLNAALPEELSREGIKEESILVVKRSAPTVSLVKNTDYSVVISEAGGLKFISIKKKFTKVSAEEKAFTVAGETVELPHKNLLPGSVKITNNAANVTYGEGVDYYVDYLNGRVTQISTGQIPPGSEKMKITYEWSTLADGEVLVASYSYTPSDLYSVKEWTNINQIVEYYGPAMSGDTIYSPIALAAQLMGSATVGASLPIIKTVCVSPKESGTGSQETVGPEDYLKSLEEKIASQDDITHICLLSADPVVWGQLATYLENRAAGS